MLGTIIGEIAGSTDEVREAKILKQLKGKSKDETKSIVLDLCEKEIIRRKSILLNTTPLFDKDSSYTDDTVLTCAIAKALLTDKDYEKKLRKFGLREVKLGLDKYGRSKFGKGFCDWLNGNYVGESFGNGCAMRISPIANFNDNLTTIIEETNKATYPSHNYEESYNAARAVNTCIYLAKKDFPKKFIKNFIENSFGYDLNFKYDDLQSTYKFTARAKDSVPQAIYCFLISNNFEDAIRKAIGIGGDSDTIAAITGSIAEVYYGIDDRLIREVERYLPEYVINIVNEFYSAINKEKPFKNELKDFFKEQGMYSEEFFDFIKDRVHILPFNTPLDCFGCFPILENDVIKDIKLLVPEIKTEKNLLVNIHEYTQALELFNELGTVYDEQRDKREARAVQMEKIYIMKKSI